MRTLDAIIAVLMKEFSKKISPSSKEQLGAAATKDGDEDAIAVTDALENDIYVPPKTGPLGLGHESETGLREELDAFLANDKDVCVILGDPGIGKTTFAKKWLSVLKEDYESDSPIKKDSTQTISEGKQEGADASELKKYIPILITLNDPAYRDCRDADGILGKYLRDAGGAALGAGEIKLLLENCNLVVFFDGYDEIDHGKSASQNSYYDDDHWAYWKSDDSWHVKFVISSRQEKFGDHQRRKQLETILIERFAPKNPLSTSERDKSKISITQIKEFDDDLIQAFIHCWVEKKTETQSPRSSQSAVADVLSAGKGEESDEDGSTPELEQHWTFEEYWHQFSRFTELKKLSRNPFILRLTLFALPQITHTADSATVQEVNTRLEVYDRFTTIWFEKSLGKYGQGKNIFDKIKAKQNKINLHRLESDYVDLFGKLDKHRGSTELTDYLMKYFQRYARNLAYLSLYNNVGSDEELKGRSQDTAKVAKGKTRYKTDLSPEETLSAKLLDSDSDPFIEDLTPDEKNLFLEELRSACLLSCKDGKFRFHHKSLVEYFAQAHIFAGAYAIADAFLKDIAGEGAAASQLHGAAGKAEEDDDADVRIDKARLQNSSLYKILFTRELSLIRFLAEQCQANPVFEKQLVDIIALSRKHGDLKIAAANAITILNYANYPISTMDLKGIKIPGADLSAGLLHGADFSDADLRGVDFTNAYLVDARFNGSQIKGCEWGRSDKAISKDIRLAAYSSSGQYLVIIDAQGVFSRINTESWELELTLRMSEEVISLLVEDIGAGTDFIFLARKSGDITIRRLSDLSFLNTLSRSEGLITSMSYHHSASTLYASYAFTSSADAKLRTWTLTAAGKESAYAERTYNKHNFTSLTFSPSGKRLAIGDDARAEIYVYDTETNQVIFKTNVGNPVTSLLFDPQDEDRLIVGCGKWPSLLSKHSTLYLWDTSDATSKPIAIGRINEPVISMAYDAAGNYLIFLTRNDNTLNLYTLDDTDSKTGMINRIYIKTLKDSRENVNFTLAPIGSNLLLLADKGIFINWQQILDEQKDKQSMQSCFTRESMELAIRHQSGWQLHDWRLGYEKQINLPDLLSSSSDVLHDLHPKENLLAYADDKTVYLYNVLTKVAKKIYISKESITHVQFNRDGSGLAVFSKEAVLTYDLAHNKSYSKPLTSIWSIQGKRLVDFSAVGDFALFTSNDRLIIYGKSKSLEILPKELYTNQLRWLGWKLLRFGKVSQNCTFGALANSDDHSYIAAAYSDHNILLANPYAGKKWELKGHTSEIATLSFSADNTRLVSSSQSGDVCIWNVQNASCLDQFSAIDCRVYSVSFAASTNDILHIAGHQSNKDTEYQVFEYQLLSGQYRLTRSMSRKYTSGSTGMDITESNGISRDQLRLLQSRKVMGEPRFFALRKDDFDEKDFAAVKRLIKQLRNRGITSVGKSVLVPENKLDYEKSWQLYLLRITDPTTVVSASGFSQIESDRHVYGVIEGLDMRGHHVWIRFDLINDRAHKKYVKIRSNVEISESASDKDAQTAFINLFSSCSRDQMNEIQYIPLGSLSKQDVFSLLQNIKSDQQRQYVPKSRFDERIAYRFTGGSPQSRLGPYNCYTWIRSRLHAFSALKYPSAAMHSVTGDTRPLFSGSSTRTFKLDAWKSFPENAGAGAKL